MFRLVPTLTLVVIVKSEIGIPAVLLVGDEAGEETLSFCNRGFTKQNIVHPHYSFRDVRLKVSITVQIKFQRNLIINPVRQIPKQIRSMGILIFVVPSIMLYSSEISPKRCNNCVFILRNGFTLHVSGDNLTHHQEYICCIWPQVSRLT